MFKIRLNQPFSKLSFVVAFFIFSTIPGCASNSSIQNMPSPLPVLAPALALSISPLWNAEFRLELLAGEGDADFSEGLGAAAHFNYPWDVAVDKQNNVLVIDRFNHRIRKITLQGEVSTLAGQRAPGYQDGEALNSQFDNPIALTVDQHNNIYIADSGNHVIRKISAEGQVSTLAGQNGKAGFRDGKASEAQFNGLSGLALDSKGNLYLADSNNHRIRKLSADGKSVSTVAGSGLQGFKDGLAQESEFFSPRDLVFNAQGELFVSDGFNHAIRKLKLDGQVITVVGNGKPGNNVGQGSAAQLNEPTGLACDLSGQLYIADTGNNLIRTLNPEGKLSTLAANGQARYQNGSLLAGSVSAPRGLALYPSGLFIADTQNHRIRKIEKLFH
jgi:sugar lactone lactonase YvrE